MTGGLFLDGRPSHHPLTPSTLECQPGIICAMQTEKHPREPLSPLNRGIGRVLRRRAGERNLNQSELARKAQVVTSQVNHWWNDDRPMKVEDFVTISQALGVDPAAFLTEARIEAEGIKIEDAIRTRSRTPDGEPPPEPDQPSA